MKLLDKLKTSKYVLTLAMVSTMLVGCNNTQSSQKLPDGVYPTTNKAAIDIRMGVKKLICLVDGYRGVMYSEKIVKWDKESDLWVFYDKKQVKFYTVDGDDCFVVANDKTLYYITGTTDKEFIDTINKVNEVKHNG